MKIHLPAFPHGIHTVSETVTAAELNLDPIVFASPITVNLRFDRHDPYLQFKCRATAHAACQCDRCMIDYHQRIDADSPMLYVLGQHPDGDVDDPEIVYLPAGTTDIDLSKDLREFIILAMPGRYLCRDDCRGLCPQCGADLNSDRCGCDASQENNFNES